MNATIIKNKHNVMLTSFILRVNFILISLYIFIISTQYHFIRSEETSLHNIINKLRTFLFRAVIKNFFLKCNIFYHC